MKPLKSFCLRLLTFLFLMASLAAAFVPAAEGALTLTPVLQGLSSPVYVTNAHDGTNRLFIVEQPGRIKVLAPGATTPTIFLDIVPKVLSGGEQGLLGLAFHPQFATNSRFFVNYTRQTDGATVIAEYNAFADPVATAASETVLLVIAQPFANHNGGMIEFGNDGFLYIGIGDGGSGNDPQNHAQNIDDLLGKILRIDIDNPAGGNLYSSPPGNPYVGATPGRDEIFAIGMRNPFRFSFDRQTGQLYAGDVGQSALEEIDLVTAGGNYGWRVYEGNTCTGLDPTLCNPANFLPPITQYDHSGGRCSVTGGYVYRGTAATLPLGTYVFGDFCSGTIYALVDGTPNLLLDTTLSISSFGEDEAREIYVVGLGGTVHRLVQSGITLASSPVAPSLWSTNVALASAGAVASASSSYGAGYAVSSINNNERAGAPWAGNGGWADGTAGAWPDWVQIDFGGTKTIDRVVVYSVQDNRSNPVEPTDAMTFSLYGVVDFTVQGWNGSSWIPLATVAGNNLVKRTVTFAATPTDRIRIHVTNALRSYTRLAEVEAWGVAAAGARPTSTTLASSGTPAVAGSTVTFTATVAGTNPTGSVGFTSDGNAISGCSAVALTGSGNSRTAKCTVSNLAAGTHSIVANYAGDAGNAASSSTPLSQVITGVAGGFTSGGFEVPNLGGGFQYAPAGATWVFTGAGISGNGSGFTSGNPPAPEGVQVAFLQGSGSRVAQSASIAAGTYTLSIRAAQRGNYQSGTQVLRVLVDGVPIGQYQPPSTAYTNYQTPAFTIATTGSHTLSLVGIGAGSDFTAFVDDVRLTATVVTPAGQTISFGALANRTLAASPFTVSATASSGLPVSFSSLTAPVCTVSGTTVTLVATGTCTIRAAQAGNANFNPAPNVDRSFTVSPAVAGGFTNGGFEVPNLGGGFQYAPAGATWVFTGAGISGNGSGFTSGNPPAPEGVQVAFLQGSGSRVAQSASIAAGTYTLSIRAAQRGNYQSGTQVLRVLVDGVPIGQYQPPSTAYTNYQTPAFTIATTGSHTLSLVGIGAGSDFTAFVDDVRLTATVVTPAGQTISFGALANRTLAASPFTVSATASSGLPVSFSSLTAPVCTVSGTTVTLVATGTCTIRAAQAGNANFNPAPNVDRSFTVSPAATGIGPFSLDARNLDLLPSNTWTRLYPGPDKTFYNTGYGRMSPTDPNNPIPGNANVEAHVTAGVSTLTATNYAIEIPVQSGVPLGGGFVGTPYGNGKMLYFGGGHSGYSANRVNVWSLATGRWSQSQYTPDMGLQIAGGGLAYRTPTPPGIGCKTAPFNGPGTGRYFATTGDITAGSKIVNNVAVLNNMCPIVGLCPGQEQQTGGYGIFGNGIPVDAAIYSVDRAAHQVTMTHAATATASSVALTGGKPTCETGGTPNGSTGGRGWWEHSVNHYHFDGRANAWMFVQVSGTWFYDDVNETWRRASGPHAGPDVPMLCGGSDYTALGTTFAPELNRSLAWCSTGGVFGYDYGSGAPNYTGARWVQLNQVPSSIQNPQTDVLGQAVWNSVKRKLFYYSSQTTSMYGTGVSNPVLYWFDPFAGSACTAMSAYPCGTVGRLDGARPNHPQTYSIPIDPVTLALDTSSPCYTSMCQFVTASMTVDSEGSLYLVGRRAGDAQIALWKATDPTGPNEAWTILQDFQFDTYDNKGLRLLNRKPPNESEYEFDINSSAMGMLNYIPERNAFILITRSGSGNGGASTRGTGHPRQGGCYLNGVADDCFRMYAIRLD